MFDTRSKRTLAAAGLADTITVVVYMALGLAGDPLPPSPYNTLIMTVLGVWTLAALLVVLIDRIDRRVVHLEVETQHTADLRYARVHALLIRLEQQICLSNGPTVAIARVAVAGVADDKLPGYARGYADGLARKPMADSNVVPIER